MIGQRQLLQRVEYDIRVNHFPQFALFVGDTGMGKKTFMRHISKKWRYQYFCEDVKVDTIRKMIDRAYQTTKEGRCIYIIPDSQKMSLQARNSILKLVEEPPTYATFAMSVDSLSNVLDTIRSRATIYYMDNYSEAEKREYISKHPGVQNEAFILKLCNSLSDIDKAVRIDPGSMIKHIETMIDKSDRISYGNLLKSAQAMSLSNEEDKFDMTLYWRAFMLVLVGRIEQAERYAVRQMYCDMSSATADAISKLSITGINKQMLYDKWALDISEIRESYDD